MARSRQSGFTLVEAMLSLSLVLLALGAFSKVAASYGTIDRKTKEKDALLDAAMVGIHSMAGDLKSASEILQPTSGSATKLRMKRVDPTATLLPLVPDPENEADPFDPFTPNTGIVQYELDGQKLLRTWYPPSGTATANVVSTGLAGLRIDDLGPRELELALTVLDGASTRTISRVVYLCSEK